ncbi:MAG: DNA replication terminus site-binding protein [Francisellaceae bacterium]
MMVSEFELKKQEQIIEEALRAIDRLLVEIKAGFCLLDEQGQLTSHFFYAENWVTQSLNDLAPSQALDIVLGYMNDDHLEPGRTRILIGMIQVAKRAESLIDQLQEVNEKKQSIQQAIAVVLQLFKGSKYHLEQFKSRRFHKRINWKMLNRRVLWLDEPIDHLTFKESKNIVSTKLTKMALLKKLKALKKDPELRSKEIKIIEQFDESQLFYMRYTAYRHSVNVFSKEREKSYRLICATPLILFGGAQMTTLSYNEISARKKRSDSGDYGEPIIDSLPIYIRHALA